MNQLDGGLGSEFLRTGIASYGKKCEVGELGEEGVDYSAALLARCSGYGENFVIVRVA